MHITTQKGMVNIESPELFYGNIQNMYKTGNGNGLQLIEQLEHKRGEIIDLCAEKWAWDIAEKEYKNKEYIKCKKKQVLYHDHNQEEHG